MEATIAPYAEKRPSPLGPYARDLAPPVLRSQSVLANDRAVGRGSRVGRHRTFAGAVWIASVSVASALAAQSAGAERLAAARAQMGAGHLDSAATLLKQVADSPSTADSADRAAAWMLLGFVRFYQGQDAETARSFRAALGFNPRLSGERLTTLDSSLAAIWQGERAAFAANLLFAKGNPGREDSSRIYPASELDQQAKVVSTPPVGMTNRAKGSHLEQVVVLTVVDAKGHPEPGSQTIVETADSGLDAAAEDFVQGMVVRPGRVRGRAVRTLVAVPVRVPTSHRAAGPEATDTATHLAAALGADNPEMIWAPKLPYPPEMRRRHIAGRVLVVAIIDTTGHAEPSSIRVFQTPDSGFNSTAIAWLLAAHFRPARVNGRLARVKIQIPIDFRIGPGW